MKNKMDYDPNHRILQRNDRAFQKLFNDESQFMAAQGYSDDADKAKLRGVLVTIIDKLSSKFDAFIPYLAVNYVDQFLSRNSNIPQIEGNPNENIKLFAICCLTIAWKMRRKKFSVAEFIESRRLVTNPLRIRIMELQILNTLEWRMRSLNAICFIDYFYPFFKLGHPQPIQGFTCSHIAQAIITIQGDIRFTRFKPSIIAASVILSASLQAFPAQFLRRTEAVLRCHYIDKDALLLCMEAIGIEVLEDVKEMKELIKIEETIKKEEAKKIDKSKKTEKGEEIENKGKGKENEEPELKKPEAQESRKAASEEDDEISKEEEDEITVMNFELNWPVAKLEGDLIIPNPEPDPTNGSM